MKRFLFAVIFSAALLLPASASEKANTVLIHPGETVYARFEIKGRKLKLVSYSKEKDEAAQVIFTLGPDAKKPLHNLKVENKFPLTLLYKTEARSLMRNLKFEATMTPVVAGKVSFEVFPKVLGELAAYAFQLEK
jgi:hypothetical protein